MHHKQIFVNIFKASNRIKCVDSKIGENKCIITKVLLPGESHGGRSLVGYSPWGCTELDTTERLHFTSSTGY